MIFQAKIQISSIELGPREDKIGPGGSLDFYFTSGSSYDIPSQEVDGREIKKFGWAEVKKNVKSLSIFLNYVVADQGSNSIDKILA